MHEWIVNHTKVVNLPISNYTWLVPDHKQPGKKIWVSKFHLPISIRELHNDIISEISIYYLKEATDNITCNPLISDTSLSALIPNNVRKMTYRYK